jgi:hypothetical protein
VHYREGSLSRPGFLSYIYILTAFDRSITAVGYAMPSDLFDTNRQLADLLQINLSLLCREVVASFSSRIIDREAHVIGLLSDALTIFLILAKVVASMASSLI